MKTVEGFVIRPLGDQFIIVGEGVKQVDFSQMVSLNSTAAYLWKKVEGKTFTVEDLAALLVEKYDVSEEIAARDAASLASKWLEIGIVEQ